MSDREADSAKLTAIIKSLGGDPEAIRPDVPIRDLGLDSLKTMELVLALEETFGIQIPDEDLTGETLGTPGTILDLIERLRPSNEV
jgi:acyl carrier protein